MDRSSIISQIPLDDDMRPALARDYQLSEDDAARRRLEEARARRERARGAATTPPDVNQGGTVLPKIVVTPDEQPRPDATFSGSDPVGDVATNNDDDGLTIGDVGRGALAVGGDVITGLSEAIPQAFGGFMDAIGEVDQFLQSALPIGGMALFDKKGNFDPRLISNEEMRAIEKAGNTLFDMIAPDDADSVTGGIVRSASQFLTGFIPGVSVARGLGLGGLAASFAGGALADAVVFDPHEARLSTLLNEIPALEGIVPDYMADHNPETQSEWEGRLKNAIEGAGIGALTDGLLAAFKYYKAQRKLGPAAEDPGARGLALREEQEAIARAEIGSDVADDLLAPIGDASPDAPLLIQTRPDETLELATKRLKDAEKRTAAFTERGDVMGRIKEIVDVRVARDAEAGRGVPTGDTAREPIDDLLDGLRANKAGPKMAARPVATIVKGLGGIDPASSFAGDLRSRGINAKSFPGLFRKNGGLENLDNIPASEHPLFADYANVDGYINEQSFIDGLEAELKGNPWRTADEQRLYDEAVAPLEDLDEHLSRLGIHYEDMSNDAVKARLRAIDEEQAAEETYLQSVASLRDADGQPRTYADLDDEQREIWSQEQIAEARAAGVSDDVIRQHEPPKVYINLARIDAENDVRALIQTLADADAAHIDAKGGGKRVSFEQMIKESDKEFLDVKDLIGRDPSTNMTRGQIVAAQRLLVSSAEQVFELSKRATAPNAGKVDRYNFAKAISVHTAIHAEVIGATREIARTLAATRIPAKADKFRTEAINEIINGMGGKNIDQVAHAVAMASNPQAAVNHIARQSLTKNVFDSSYQVFINSILSGPQTHLVNLMSTSAVMMNNVAERMLARGISKAFYGGEVASGEAQAMLHGSLHGLRDGFRLVALGARSEKEKGLVDVFDAFVRSERPRQGAISSQRYGINPAGTIGQGIDALGRFIDLPGNALEMEDRFMKTVAYRMELHAQSVRQASMEGLEGKEFRDRVAELIENPTDDIRIEAIDQARIATFTNPLGEMGQRWQRSISNSPARWVMPFVRTPTNIMKYTFERTPLAYASASIRADISAGGARAAQAHARVAMGTTMMFTIGGLASDGLVTGSGPRDHKQNAAWRAAGNQPYSVKIGDKWYAYNRMDPIGMIFGVAADAVEIQTLSSEEDASLLVGGGAVALVQNISSKTYMQGMVDFIDAVSGGNPAANVGQWMIDQTTSLTPYSALIRQTARGLDTTTRETRDVVTDADGETDHVATMLNNLANSHKRNIPWLSDELPPVRDILGRPMDIATGGGFLADFMIPIRMKDVDNDPLLREIVENEVKPSRIDRSIGGIQLSAEEYDALQILAGEMIDTLVRPQVMDPAFQQIKGGPDSYRTVLLRNAISSAHTAARSIFQERNPAFVEKIWNKREKTGNQLLGTE